MKEKKVLYQIRSLEKLILRNFCNDLNSDINTKEFAVVPTPTQMQIIEYILEHEQENVYQKDLEEVLNLRRATVSGVLQTMEKNNLLERVAHQEDARTKKIILNEKTKKIFFENEKKFQEIEKIITEHITEEELSTFSKVINRMKDNLKNMKKQ